MTLLHTARVYFIEIYMEPNERTGILQAAILAGHDREEIKRELISHGLGTADFDAEYEALLAQLGQIEPVPKVPDFVSAARNDADRSYVLVPAIPFPALLREGMYTAVRSWKTLLGIGFIGVLPALAMLLLGMLIHVPALAVLLVMFLSWIIHVLMFGMVLRLGIDNGEGTFAGVFSWSLSHFMPLLWLCIFLFFVVLGGAVFLIVPGVFVLLCSVFAFIVFSRENARGGAALMRSLDLINGGFWQTVSRVGMLTLIFGLPMLILSFVSLSFSSSFATLPLTYVCAVASLALCAAGVGALTALYAERAQAKPLFDYSLYRGIKWIYRLLFIIGLGIAAIAIVANNWFALFLNAQIMKDLEVLQQQELVNQDSEGERGGFNVGDFLIRSKVETTAASVKIFGAKMGDYNGSCDDVTVVAPIECRANSKSFAVFAPLSGGGAYCVDASGFSGAVVVPAAFSCQ